MDCNKGNCVYCIQTKTKDKHGFDEVKIFCTKTKRAREILGKDWFPFPKWCLLTKEERKIA